jgi:high affinity Mn2+ porin
LTLGGNGLLFGDGALRYGRETIAEIYYTAHLWRGVFASADLQHISTSSTLATTEIAVQ